MPADAGPHAGSGTARPGAGAPRSAHRPIDEALAPFADLLRQQLPTPDEIEQAAARRRAPRPTGHLSGRSAAATTAAVAALGAVAVLLWADPALQRQTLATAVGERSRTVLADGSEVRLNTGSRVEVAQHLRSRRLVLAAGEASFHVAHAPWHAVAPWLQRPFTVRAGRVVVEDVGTVFNVRRHGSATDDQGTAVTVLQGRVRVHAAPGAAPAVEMSAGQSLHVPPHGRLPAPRAEPAAGAAARAWHDGWLVLDATPLAAAVAEMQRHRAAPIVLADAQAAALRVSGQFHLDRLDQLLDLLPRLAPVQVQRQADGGVVISTPR